MPQNVERGRCLHEAELVLRGKRTLWNRVLRTIRWSIRIGAVSAGQLGCKGVESSQGPTQRVGILRKYSEKRPASFRVEKPVMLFRSVVVGTAVIIRNGLPKVITVAQHRARDPRKTRVNGVNAIEYSAIDVARGHLIFELA